MKARHGCVPAVLIAALVAVTGATEIPAGSASAATREAACSLLREREIERVLGFPVTNKKPMQDPVGASLCTWTVDGTGDARVIAVYLARRDGLKRGYMEARTAFSGAARERVDGLGKRAFYAVPVSSVYLLRDGALVYVQNLDGRGTTDPAAIRDQAVELARLVVGRL